MTKSTLIDQIDDLLPQTQCGLCSYGACRPYAQAIVEQKESIDRCPPGGTKTLVALANLLQQDPSPFLEDMAVKAKPFSVAVIREDECIGCTKCIQACPVDAILGAAKKMHTILTDECTGCELCIEPCPVDCIDMITLANLSEEQQLIKSNQFRSRYNNRLNRINRLPMVTNLDDVVKPDSISDRKAAINAAIERAQARKKATQ